MAFKMRSGNKPGFKNMGSSPAKDMKTGSYEHSFESPAKERPNYAERIKGVQDARNTETAKKAKTKVDIKQKSKTDKQRARGGDTPGGRRVTRAERDMIRDDKLNEQLDRAKTLEAAGKGERGFSWKEAGMSVLRGEGLLGNIASGMGKGRYKSEIIKDKQTKIAGKKERKTIATKQKDERKAARKLKKQSMVNKIKKASNLNTDILDD